ncbi:zinc alcohol dehydrogenase [Melanomma pulvis-pyrius CBS 109.77]|uniref:Zinc alcohol dehydrogenase n=1 Tax=Melanomma pulvis-pyrius CBS 109.77 TaxID=1314802 RepID=A0A6A6XW00_9PLEO|nr:zinc alcohol dehydrogenase [Melanomma pulvis-pyrius CBS 109.77]
MQAWTHTSAGPHSAVLSLIQIPIPAILSPTQVLIRISHAALNPGASIIMKLLPFVFRCAPAIPEMDFSGVIIKCGSSVPPARNLQNGTHVFGSIPVGQHVKSTSGALAEFVVVEHEAIVRKPDAAILEEVVGLGIAGASALQLLKYARLKKGDSVLVNGASGGIGHLVLQMCRAEVGETGRVVAVCSTDNVGWVREYGADEVIDYKAHDSVQTHLATAYASSRFNAVIDAVGIQDIFNHCPAFLAEGKPFVSIGPKAKSYTYGALIATIGLMLQNALLPRFLGGVPREYAQVTGITNLEAMEQLAKMMEKGTLRVKVGTVVTMRDVPEAYQKLLSGHAQGKIVVKIQHEST